jgi:hypothetical protein
MNVEEAIKEILEEQLGIWSGLIDINILIHLVEALLEYPLIGKYQ